MALTIDLQNKKMLPWHLLGWFVLIAYEITFLMALEAPRTPLGLFLSYSLCIMLFYFHAYVIMPIKNRYWLILLIPLEIFVFYLIEMSFEHIKLFVADTYKLTPVKTLLIQYTYRGIYFVSFATVYWLFMNALRSRERLLKLEKQRIVDERLQTDLEMKLVRSQNAKLRSQIEPHFIFNTMNFIYDSVESVSEKAGETILLLSEMMHYALQKTDDDYEVPLQVELENIRNLIRINNIRTNNRLHVKLETDLDNEDDSVLKTLPLLFITFVENMYKHGDLTNEQVPGIIYVSAKNGELLFTTWNKKRQLKALPGNSMGIANAKERLLNFYNEKQFSLSVNDNAEGYSVELKIEYAYDKLLYN